MCARLVVMGRKRATASALIEYEIAADPLPQPEEFLIVTDWSGEAKALIQTRTVTIRRFCDVSTSFAALEGEGDGTLAWWRDAHRAFWNRTLVGITHTVDDNFQIVCEEFELVLAA